MDYKKRIIEDEFGLKLSASGAVLVRGPKSCGKTETARQFAKSVLQVDKDVQVPTFINTEPQKLLFGNTPRLLDEWQEEPKLWNYVRHEVDDRKKKGQFILTGSANPDENARMHSGAGRFTIVNMRTMSWQELGYSSGIIKMSELLKGKKKQKVNDEMLSLDIIVERIIRGGWPALMNVSINKALVLNRAHIDLLAEVDMSRVSNVKRDPVKVRALLKSLSRNTATLVENTTLEKDIKTNEASEMSRPTIIDYLDALSRLMILDEQPAFNLHIKSSASLRKSPKRHLCDASLSVAALELDKNSLLKNPIYVGNLFETHVYNNLKVYASANDANVYHYRDSSGLEVDAIVQQYGGNYAAFEVKLGMGMIDEAANNLLKFAKNVNETKMKKPSSLNIVVGVGMSFTRPDGVNVISLASLGR
jgi:predicted AAA+ superfamily ATPase